MAMTMTMMILPERHFAEKVIKHTHPRTNKITADDGRRTWNRIRRRKMTKSIFLRFPHSDAQAYGRVNFVRKCVSFFRSTNSINTSYHYVEHNVGISNALCWEISQLESRRFRLSETCDLCWAGNNCSLSYISLAPDSFTFIWWLGDTFFLGRDKWRRCAAQREL